MSMNPKLIKFASDMLLEAACKATNNCCNDLPPKYLESFGFTEEEKQEIALEIAQLNEKTLSPKDITEFHNIKDYTWYWYFAQKLEKLING